MPTLQIRTADLADATDIALLGRITFAETFGHLFRDQQDLLNYLDQTFSVPKIRSSVAKENNLFLIALADDLPVGYAKLKKHSPTPFIDSDRAAQLQKIYVLKDFISKGIGQRMLEEINQQVVNLEKEFLWLSVHTGNQKAISFYQRNNFIPCGYHTFQIGKEIFDFIVLKKQL